MSQIECALPKSVKPDKFEYTINFELKNESTNQKIQNLLLYFVRTNLILTTRPWHMNKK
jgi:hypothetical protein